MDGDTQDIIAGFRAQADQAVAATADLARVTFAHYSALVEEGFAPEQALMLTASLQASLLGGAS